MDDEPATSVRVQEFSDFIAVGNLQMNRVLGQLGWKKLDTKNDLQCYCHDKTHQVKAQHKDKHLIKCTFQKYGIAKSEREHVPNSVFSCSDKTQTPVFLNKETLKGFSISPDVCNMMPDFPVNSSLLETNADLNNYTPCDALDELRFIYSWTKVPRRYYEIEPCKIDSKTVKQQMENLIENNEIVIKNEEEVVNCIMNRFLSCVKLNVDQLNSQISHLFTKDSSAFVFDLWKFLCAKILCHAQSIPEHTHCEFSAYSTPTKKSRDNQAFPAPPIEYFERNVSREQRLKIYEYVSEIGRQRADYVEFSQVALDTEEQMNMINALQNKGEKTHLQVLAEMRDYKRRRQSYRGKTNMSKKLSLIETNRDLIKQQMLYLSLLAKEKEGENIKNDCELSNETKDENVNILSTNQSSDPHNEPSPKKDESNRKDKSRDRSHRSPSRDKDRRRRSRSREKRRNRSRSKERRHRSRSKERRNRDRHHSSRDKRHDNQHKHDRTGQNSSSYHKDNKFEISNVTVYE